MLVVPVNLGPKMPQRKPFRPHKNRPRDRFQSGAEDDRSGGQREGRRGDYRGDRPAKKLGGKPGGKSGGKPGGKPGGFQAGPRNARDNARRQAERREKAQNQSLAAERSDLKPDHEDRTDPRPSLKGP